MSEKKLEVGVEIKYLNNGQGIERAALDLIRMKDAAVASAREGAPAVDQLAESQRKQTTESERQRTESDKAQSANMQNIMALKLLKDASEVAQGSLRPLPGMFRDLAESAGSSETALSKMGKGIGTLSMAIGAFAAGFKIGEVIGDAAIAMHELAKGAGALEEALERAGQAADKTAKRHQTMQAEIKKTNEQLDEQRRRLKEISDAEDSLDKARTARSSAAANLQKAQIAAGTGTAGEKAVGAAMVDRAQASEEYQQQKASLERNISMLTQEQSDTMAKLNRWLKEQAQYKQEQADAEREYKAKIEELAEQAGEAVSSGAMANLMKGLYNNYVPQYSANGKLSQSLSSSDELALARDKYRNAGDELRKFDDGNSKSIKDLQTTLDVLPKKIEEAKVSLEKVGDDYKTKLVEAGGKLEEAGKQIKADIEAAAKTLEDATKARQEAQSARQLGGGPAEDKAFTEAVDKEKQAAAELQRLRSFMEQLTPALSSATAQIINEQGKHADALIRSSQDMSTRIVAVHKETATAVATAARESGGEQAQAIRDASANIIGALGDLADKVGSIAQRQAAQQADLDTAFSLLDNAGRKGDVAVSQANNKPAPSLLSWSPISW